MLLIKKQLNERVFLGEDEMSCRTCQCAHAASSRHALDQAAEAEKRRGPCSATLRNRSQVFSPIACDNHVEAAHSGVPIRSIAPYPIQGLTGFMQAGAASVAVSSATYQQ